MSKKANPTVIGAFIVGGVALLMSGLILFSSLKIFSRTWKHVLYFDTSLNGLAEGAPVKYRGVAIGKVKKVMIRFNQKTNDNFMPVIIELENKLLKERMEDSDRFRNAADVEAATKKGLRGTLKADSLVTGVLYVELNTVSNAPPPVLHQMNKTYVEIPTKSSDISQLLENLGRVDFKGFESRLSELITNVSKGLSELKLGEIGSGVTNALGGVNRFVSSAELTNTLVSVQKAMSEYEQLGKKLNGRVDPVMDSVTNALEEAQRTLKQLRVGVEDLSGMVAPDSQLQRHLQEALEQITDAAQSVGALADFLERNPNAIITGRKKSK